MTQSNVGSPLAGSAKGRMPERVVLLDPEVLDAVQHKVHARDGRPSEVLLLGEDAPAEGAWIGAGPLRMLGGAEQQAAGAAGRVVDGLARLRVEQVDHHPHDGARRVEPPAFLRRVMSANLPIRYS